MHATIVGWQPVLTSRVLATCKQARASTIINDLLRQHAQLHHQLLDITAIVKHLVCDKQNKHTRWVSAVVCGWLLSPLTRSNSYDLTSPRATSSTLSLDVAMQAKSLAVSVGCRRGAMQLQGQVDNAAMVLASYRTLLEPSRLKAAVHRHSRRLAAWLCVLGGIHFLGSRERLLFGLRTV